MSRARFSVLGLIALALPLVVASAPQPPRRFFSDSSFWNLPLAAQPEVDPRSPELVSHPDGGGAGPRRTPTPPSWTGRPGARGTRGASGCTRTAATSRTPAWRTRSTATGSSVPGTSRCGTARADPRRHPLWGQPAKSWKGVLRDRNGGLDQIGAEHYRVLRLPPVVRRGDARHKVEPPK